MRLIKSIGTWLDARLQLGADIQETMGHRIPRKSASWFYVFGSAAFAEVDPGLVPAVLASGPGRLLLADVPGADCWDASPQVAANAVGRLATAQARIGPPPLGVPDRRRHTHSLRVVGDFVRIEREHLATFLRTQAAEPHVRPHGVRLAEGEEGQVPGGVVPHVWGVAAEHDLGHLGYLQSAGLVGQMDLQFPEGHHGGSVQGPSDEVGLLEGEAVLQGYGGLSEVAHL